MIKLKNIRFLFLTLYIVFYMLYPKIYLFDFITFFIFIGYFLSNTNKLFRIKRIIPYIFSIILFYFIPSLYYGALQSSLINFLDFIVRISPIFVGLNELKYIKRESDINKYKIIRKIIIVLIIYISIINIYYLSKNPYFARIMANFRYDVPGLSFLGTISGGGYFIVYGFILLICFLFKAVFITKKNIVLNLFMLGFILLFLIKANFATAFVMTIVSILILIFIENLNKQNLISLLLLIVTIILIINYKNLTNFVILKLPTDSIISSRLSDAINKNDDSTANERLSLMIKSVNTIKNNFIFGISAKNNHKYDNIISQAGLHTEWLDFFARYGVVLSFWYYLFIYKSFGKLIESGIDKKLFESLFVSVILIGCFNPVLNSGCFLIVFVIIPILIIGEKNEKNI